MNKQTIITIMFALVWVAGQGQIPYRLEGKIGKPEFSGRLALTDYFGTLVDSVDIENGEIMSLEGTLPDTAICSIIEKSSDIWLYPIFLGGGTTRINGDTWDGPLLSGTPLCDDYRELLDSIRAVSRETLKRMIKSGKKDFNLTPDEKGRKHIADISYDIISRHTSDVLGFYLLREGVIGNYLEPVQWLSLAEKLLPWLKTKPELHEALTQYHIPLYEAAAKTGVGCKFVDVETEVDGETSKLSDYVGRGNYTIVNFWGTTCPPCIAELPELMEMHQQYGTRGVTVLGIPAYEEVERSRKGIEKYQLTYPQLLNTQDKATAAYGVLNVPETILFSPDGTILARGLTIDELKAKLEKIFKDE